MKTRGERLKARRLELGLTMKEAAARVGISLPGIQNLERGDVMPSLEIGVSLAKCYKKSVNWVLNGENEEQARIPVAGTTDTGPKERSKTEHGKFEDSLPLSSCQYGIDAVYALTINQQIATDNTYRAGDALLIDSVSPLITGEDTLIRRADGEISVLKLARIDDNRYYFDAPDKGRVIVDKSELTFVHQIIGLVKGFLVERDAN
jgi:transcriptional regulator with XRE-family HTH domain